MTETFDADNTDLVFGGRVTNFWDISDNATVELGGSIVSGPASPEYYGTDSRVSVYGVDITYKWICGTQSHGPALTIQSELLVPDLSDDYSSPHGWYAMGLYRFHHNWWAGACYGTANTDIESGTINQSLLGINSRESKFNITFAPSEFSAIRAEVVYTDDVFEGNDDLSFGLQTNFTIGSHPAHIY